MNIIIDKLPDRNNGYYELADLQLVVAMHKYAGFSVEEADKVVSNACPQCIDKLFHMFCPDHVEFTSYANETPCIFCDEEPSFVITIDRRPYPILTKAEQDPNHPEFPQPTDLYKACAEERKRLIMQKIHRKGPASEPDVGDLFPELTTALKDIPDDILKDMLEKTWENWDPFASSPCEKCKKIISDGSNSKHGKFDFIDFDKMPDWLQQEILSTKHLAEYLRSDNMTPDTIRDSIKQLILSTKHLLEDNETTEELEHKANRSKILDKIQDDMKIMQACLELKGEERQKLLSRLSVIKDKRDDVKARLITMIENMIDSDETCASFKHFKYGEYIANSIRGTDKPLNEDEKVSGSCANCKKSKENKTDESVVYEGGINISPNDVNFKDSLGIPGWDNKYAILVYLERFYPSHSIFSKMFNDGNFTIKIPGYVNELFDASKHVLTKAFFKHNPYLKKIVESYPSKIIAKFLNDCFVDIDAICVLNSIDNLLRQELDADTLRKFAQEQYGIRAEYTTTLFNDTDFSVVNANREKLIRAALTEMIETGECTPAMFEKYFDI